MVSAFSVLSEHETRELQFSTATRDNKSQPVGLGLRGQKTKLDEFCEVWTIETKITFSVTLCGEAACLFLNKPVTLVKGKKGILSESKFSNTSNTGRQ